MTLVMILKYTGLARNGDHKELHNRLVINTISKLRKGQANQVQSSNSFLYNQFLPHYGISLVFWKTIPRYGFEKKPGRYEITQFHDTFLLITKQHKWIEWHSMASMLQYIAYKLMQYYTPVMWAVIRFDPLAGCVHVRPICLWVINGLDPRAYHVRHGTITTTTTPPKKAFWPAQFGRWFMYINI